MEVKYTILLKSQNGHDQQFNGSINIDSEFGYFGDKDYNRKVAEAIYSKHPNCTILEFGPPESVL